MTCLLLCFPLGKREMWAGIVHKRCAAAVQEDHITRAEERLGKCSEGQHKVETSGKMAIAKARPRC